MEGGSQNRDSDFHTQYRLDRPVEKTSWGGTAFGEKLLADSESLLWMKESVVKL
jgi:hypothetical protein